MPFLTRLDDAQLDRVAAAGTTLSLAADQMVFRQGDRAEDLFAILSGEIRIFLRDDEGNESTLAVLQPGDYFGEMGLLDGGTRSASAATIAPSELFVVGRDAFLALLTSSSPLLRHVLSDLTARTRETSRRFFEEELSSRTLQSRMELERHRALSQLVAGVAHELNTPIGISNTALSIIKRALRAPEVSAALAGDAATRTALADMREALDLIERNLARAHKLTRDFKKVSAGELHDPLEDLDLSHVIDEVVSLFGINAKKAGLRIAVHDALRPEQRAWRGYRGLLTQVVLNCLTNIERYAYPERGGGDGRIDIELRLDEARQEPSYLLSIRDHGRGIPEANLTRIFEPFFTTGRAVGGTGLGMAIVKNIVTGSLGGTIDIASSPGHGTTVTVAFPRLAKQGAR